VVWIVAVAGGLGAVARYLLDGWVQNRRDTTFPLGTFVINISGSLALGVLAGLVLYSSVDPDVRMVAGVGLLGGYTTFSTLTYESLQLAQAGARRAAMSNIVGSTAIGLVAAATGIFIAAAFS
jgi:fluoride exporter